MEVQHLTSDDARSLMARGVHDKESVIKAAIEAGEIDDCDSNFFSNGNLTHGWYKATPREGFNTFYYPSTEGIRGAFEATFITCAW